MNPITTRTGRVAAASLLSFGLVPLAVIDQLSARVTGEEYLLEVAPVDPIDPFRGAYVALTYPGLPTSADPSDRDRADVAYVPLSPAGDVWVGRTPVSERPEAGPFLRCQDDGWRLRCGIDSWFLPQERALAMENAVRAGTAVARIRVDSRGNAALVDVELRGAG